MVRDASHATLLTMRSRLWHRLPWTLVALSQPYGVVPVAVFLLPTAWARRPSSAAPSPKTHSDCRNPRHLRKRTPTRLPTNAPAPRPPAAWPAIRQSSAPSHAETAAPACAGWRRCAPPLYRGRGGGPGGGAGGGGRAGGGG